MVRLDGRMLVVALVALLPACGRESRQPEQPTVAPSPSPAVQSSPAPTTPPPPDDPALDPQKAPKDSSGGSQTYPWKSGPIAAL